ncbi:cytochrome d ubiquinol oxidase subunit II [Planosporangium sp. 12N6]|uniref:cytochrome d ubiquinol oxidase subunit II n=1 Tax=Planosporangium spinosum TaxID=3402278 RepID=UPI003CF96DA4
MAEFWYALLGLLLVGYFVLGGMDVGVGLVLPLLPAHQRRAALNALGPFFLGNEVWIVAAGGVLFAAFPHVEGDLLATAYPLAAALLAALAALNAGVQLRSRPAGAGARRRFDALVAAAALVLALGWGLLAGNLLTGLPLRAGGGPAPVSALLGGFPTVVALAGAALAAMHGSAYLAWRTDSPAARRIGTVAAPSAAALVTAAVAVGATDARVRAAVAHPVAALVAAGGVVVAALVAWLALRADRPRPAVAATAVAMALPVLLVGVALLPNVLVSTLDPAASRTVADGAAGPATLRLLAWLAAPVVPLLFALQAATWWLFRGRTARRCW